MNNLREERLIGASPACIAWSSLHRRRICSMEYKGNNSPSCCQERPFRCALWMIWSSLLFLGHESLYVIEVLLLFKVFAISLIGMLARRISSRSACSAVEYRPDFRDGFLLYSSSELYFREVLKFCSHLGEGLIPLLQGKHLIVHVIRMERPDEKIMSSSWRSCQCSVLVPWEKSLMLM